MLVETCPLKGLFAVPDVMIAGIFQPGCWLADLFFRVLGLGCMFGFERRQMGYGLLTSVVEFLGVRGDLVDTHR